MPEKERGNWKREAACPGLLWPQCGEPATAQRPDPRRDSESQKVNPFIPEAQTGEVLKHPRHLLGSFRLLLLIMVTTHPCLLSMLISNVSFHA